MTKSHLRCIFAPSSGQNTQDPSQSSFIDFSLLLGEELVSFHLNLVSFKQVMQDRNARICSSPEGRQLEKGRGVTLRTEIVPRTSQKPLNKKLLFRNL